MDVTTVEKLEVEVVRWAKQKGIFDESSAVSQMDKMIEEVGELDDEVIMPVNREAIKNELGDVLVTCVIQAHFQGLHLQTCLEAALNKITKRTGRMINGQFVKDSY